MAFHFPLLNCVHVLPSSVEESLPLGPTAIHALAFSSQATAERVAGGWLGGGAPVCSSVYCVGGGVFSSVGLLEVASYSDSALGVAEGYREETGTFGGVGEGGVDGGPGVGVEVEDAASAGASSDEEGAVAVGAEGKGGVAGGEGTSSGEATASVWLSSCDRNEVFEPIYSDPRRER